MVKALLTKIHVVLRKQTKVDVMKNKVTCRSDIMYLLKYTCMISK